MQPNDWNNGQGMPPMTPEQMQQWQQWQQAQQQYSAPAQMMPEQMQQWQQQGFAQQIPPELQDQWQMMQMQMQQMQMPQSPPPSAKPPRRHHPLGRILRLVLVLAVIGGVAWLFLKDMKSSAPTTATIEMATLGTTYRGDALIVRNETAYDDEGVQSVDYKAQEGGVVYRGDVICYVYSTGYSTKEMTSLQDNRDQIKDYQRTLLKSETAYDQKMERLESEVIERGLEVRSLVQGARGNLINQEEILYTAITQRQNFFRSKYSSDTRLNRLYDDENTQQQRINSWIKQRVAPQESIVSFYTDGFEYALSPAEYEKYTPTEVRAMINGQRPEKSSASRGRTDIYRLIKKNNYAVLMLIKDNTWNPVEGTTYKLKLEQFSNTVVNAQVLSFTRSGGELLVRLAVIGDVTPVMYMRTCEAELGEYADCMTVPSGAIYEQNGSKGVVVVNGEQQIFVPVNIISESGGKVYISAIQTGVLGVGQTVRLFR